MSIGDNWSPQPLNPVVGPSLILLARSLRAFSFVATERIRGRAGQRIRAQWLSEHPLCEHCERKGRVTAATEVDHIVPLSKGGEDDDSNRQSLCAECHKAKTAQDMGHRERVTIGADGMPIGRAW